jgi:hypothetical protein
MNIEERILNGMSIEILEEIIEEAHLKLMEKLLKGLTTEQ